MEFMYNYREYYSERPVANDLKFAIQPKNLYIGAALLNKPTKR